MAAYNSYIHMAYGSDNVLTRIIDAVKEHGLESFTPAKVTAILKEGGETPEQTVKACITCRTVGYVNLGHATPYFVRLRRGIYTLAVRE